MTCAELEILLCDYVDGTLRAEERTALDSHLAGCSACAELAKDVAGVTAFIETVAPAEPPAELLTRILHEMEDNLETPLSARQLANRAGISVRALGRILRDRVGESPMRYYLKVRLQAARNSLFYSDIPIQGIAASCGFSCPEVFSRSFRSHFGVSPRDFRQQFAREQLRRFRPELEPELGR